MTTFTVHGNYGQLTAKVSTGVVIQYEPSKEGQTEYADIVRFDVEEYAAAYPGENLEWIDVCDIGFWTTAGEYEPPVSEYRAEIASIRHEAETRQETIEAGRTGACKLVRAGEWPESSLLKSAMAGGAGRVAHLIVVVDNDRSSHSSTIGGPSSGS